MPSEHANRMMTPDAAARGGRYDAERYAAENTLRCAACHAEVQDRDARECSRCGMIFSPSGSGA